MGHREVDAEPDLSGDPLISISLLPGDAPSEANAIPSSSDRMSCCEPWNSATLTRDLG